MKNLVWLICVLSLSYSCKQIQLTSNFNKRSKKIYVKPTIKSYYIDVTTIKHKTADYLKQKPINKIEKNTFSSNIIVNKEAFFADAGTSEIKVILNDKIQQKLTRVDSIIKSQNNHFTEKEDILEKSKRVKKISIVSLINAIMSGISYLIAFPTVFDFLHVFGAVFGIGSFILSIITLMLIKKFIKKNKKKGEKIKEQDKTIKNNIKVAFWISLLILSSLFAGGLIFLLNFSI